MQTELDQYELYINNVMTRTEALASRIAAIVEPDEKRRAAWTAAFRLEILQTAARIVRGYSARLPPQCTHHPGVMELIPAGLADNG